MQKIRDRFHRPLSLARFVVGCGLILFLMGIFLLQDGPTAAEAAAARLNLVRAGWLLSIGWLLNRIEDRHWPFEAGLRLPRGFRRVPRKNLLVFAVACIGAMIWRSYGLPEKGYPAAPAPLAKVVAGPYAGGAGSSGLLPAPGPTLSLTGTWQAENMLIAQTRGGLSGASLPLGIPAHLRSRAPRAFDSAQVSAPFRGLPALWPGRK